MASLDFIIDILERVESQKIDYYLITVQEEKNGDHKADVFFNFTNSASAESALIVNDNLIKEIKNKFGINSEKKTPKKDRKSGGKNKK
jgi:hypothetical protein